MTSVRKILVPTDFSPNAADATAWAADLARRYDASITLLHVQPPMTLALPEGYLMPSMEHMADLLVTLGKALDEARVSLEATERIAVATRLLEGAPFAEIVRFAREGSFDLIVMGTHGRTGLKHALVGSVAEKVVRKAPCPVLTVRLKGHSFAQP